MIDITSEIIIVVLTSSALAGVISTIVGYIQGKGNNRLQYITAERKEWRKEMRQLVEELVDANDEDLPKILTRLKVRINPYGIAGLTGEKRYYEDSHVWEAIKKIENKVAIEENRTALIHYISFLLKKDWERSKYEVIGGWGEKVTFIVFLCGIIPWMIMAVYGYSVRSEGELAMMTIILGVVLVLAVCYPKEFKINIDDYKNRPGIELLKEWWALFLESTQMLIFVGILIIFFNMTLASDIEIYRDMTLISTIMLTIYFMCTWIKRVARLNERTNDIKCLKEMMPQIPVEDEADTSEIVDNEE